MLNPNMQPIIENNKTILDKLLAKKTTKRVLVIFYNNEAFDYRREFNNDKSYKIYQHLYDFKSINTTTGRVLLRTLILKNVINTVNTKINWNNIKSIEYTDYYGNDSPNYSKTVKHYPEFYPNIIRFIINDDNKPSDVDDENINIMCKL